MTGLTFPVSEFEARRDRVIEALERRELDAVLLWSRGGGPLERFANVYYLTDHYPAFPTIPDVEGEWRARGYVAALVTRRGEVGLATDSLIRSEDCYATILEHSLDVIAATGRVVGAADLGGGRVAVIGGDTLSVAHARALADQLPKRTLRPVDDFVEELRMVKSPVEQELVGRAADVGRVAVRKMLAAAQPGATEASIVAVGVAHAVERGAAFYNAFAEVSGPGHERRRHRLPTYKTTNELREGDVFAVDISGALDGYFFDTSRSTSVGEPVGDGEALIDLARDAVRAVVGALAPGVTVGHAVRAGLAVLEAAGHEPLGGTFPAFGHGLGLGWERPWLRPNDQTLIVPGMVLAVEKDLELGPYSASYEDDVLITEDGAIVLTDTEAGHPASEIPK